MICAALNNVGTACVLECVLKTLACRGCVPVLLRPSEWLLVNHERVSRFPETKS